MAYYNKGVEEVCQASKGIQIWSEKIGLRIMNETDVSSYVCDS